MASGRAFHRKSSMLHWHRAHSVRGSRRARERAEYFAGKRILRTPSIPITVVTGQIYTIDFTNRVLCFGATDSCHTQLLDVCVIQERRFLRLGADLLASRLSANPESEYPAYYLGIERQKL